MLRALVGIRLKPIAGKIKPRGWVARRQSLHPLAVDGARMSWFGVAYLPSKVETLGTVRWSPFSGNLFGYGTFPTGEFDDGLHSVHFMERPD